jgi:Flp pilus assembly protein TadG
MFSAMSDWRKDEEGGTLVFVAVCLTVLLGFAALTFDLGRMAATQSDLQGFADHVALAAAGDLDGGDDAIARANSLDVAFQAAVFSKNIDTCMQVYKQIDAAAVMVNDHTAFRVDWMPFAGLKHSGHGVGGIPHTFKEMQIEKMMVIRSPSL